MKKLFCLILAVALIPAPTFAQNDLSKRDRDYLEGVYRDTFRFIYDYVHPKTGLPYDSSKKGAPTSTTNIGFYLASIAVAGKTGLIPEKLASNRIEAALNSLNKIKKWHGFPITWVNVANLSQEFGHSFSYADHVGNLIASLLTVKELYPEFRERIERYIEGFNFEILYDDDSGWLKGGFSTKTNDFTIKQPWGEWYYNLVGSDTRFLSFYGIAEGSFPMKHWNFLEWLTEEKYGFEYLVPGWQGGGLFMQYISAIFLPEQNTEIGESARNFSLAQMEHAKQLNYPVWGWSACEAPWGEYRGWGKIMDRVITPHASVMAINDFPGEVLKNLKEFQRLGVRKPFEGENYGFRDSIDMRSKKVANVYLMLDQTMLFLSLANFLHDGIIQKAAMSDPIVQKGFEDIYKPKTTTH